MFGRSFGVFAAAVVLSLSTISLGAAYSGGDGSANSPYLISSVADWLELMNPANSADWSKTFKLTTDIDFKGAEITPVGPDTEDDATYSFQGTPFSGVFDGQNFRLLNAVINQPAKDYVGVFGQIFGKAQVRNLGVENVRVTGRNYVGGLAGASSSKIIYCYVKGAVKGGRFVGGLVGQGSRMEYCYTEVSVEGVNTVGGLVGSQGFNTIRYCYSQGTVQGVDYVGGLGGRMGLNGDTGSILNCYSTCQVTGVNYVGGFVGLHDGECICACYSSGLVSGTTYTGGFVGQNNLVYIGHWLKSCRIVSCYWDIQSSGQTESAGGSGKTTAQMQDNNTYDKQHWDFRTTDGNPAVWFMHEGGYPALAFQKQMTMPDVAGIPFAEAGEMLSANDVGLHFTIGLEYSDTTAGDIVVSQMPAAGTPLQGNSTVHIVLSCPTSGYSGGDGSIPNPYRIGSVSGWIHLSQSPSDWDKRFVLTSDIDFKGAHITPIAENQNTSSDSFSGTSFSGVMDGRGYTLRNAIISQEDRYYVGVFGFVDGGFRTAILNLGLERIHVSGGSSTGGLAGLLRNSGIIKKCSFEGTVKGRYATGGLVGSLEASSSIQESFAAGQVYGFRYVGGLAGDSYGKIETSCATSAVSGMDWVGGLVGKGGNCYLNNCYATGSVDGYDTVGGLTGSSGFIYNCYAVGAVGGASNTGGLSGVKNVENQSASFWDVEATGQTISGKGTGKTTAQMKMRSTFIDAGWDFTDTWVMCEGTNYPRLKVQIMPADLVCPDGVNTEDLAYMMQEWMRTNCIPTNEFCSGADVDESGAVDIADFAILAEQWLETGPYFTMLPAVPASVAWWRMDYSPEQGIRDSAGGHHGITCNIAQNPYIGGRRGHPRQTFVDCVRLDGIDDYVEVPDYKGVCGAVPRSCTAWIFPAEFNREQVILSWGGNAAGQKWMFRVGADNKLAVGVWGGYIQTKEVLQPGQWYHVTAVLDDDKQDNKMPSVDDIRLFINGLPAESAANSTQVIDTTSVQDVQIGSVYNGTTQTSFFKGILDDVRIFDRALTDQQVRLLYLE